MRHLLRANDLFPAMGFRGGRGVVTVLAGFTLDDPPVLWPEGHEAWDWAAQALENPALDEGRPKPRAEFLAPGKGLRVQVGEVAATLDGTIRLPPDAPDRARLLGAFDRAWLLQRWPDLPEGTDPEFFMTAPGGQRMPGFFRGDEAILIGAAPGRRTGLPRIRVRAFLDQLEGAAAAFREIPMRAETLWLFPEQGKGILLFRGSARVADEDLDDVRQLLAVWEPLAAPPEPVEHYQDLARNLAEDAQTDPPAEPPEVQPSPGPEPEPSPAPAAPEPPVDPELAAARAKVENLEAFIQAELDKAGIRLPAPATPPAPAPPAPTPGQVLPGTPDELVKFLDQALARLKTSLPFPEGPPPAPAPAAPALDPLAAWPGAAAILARLRGLGPVSPDLEQAVQSLDAQIRQGLAAAPPAPPAEPPAPPGAPAAPAPPTQPEPEDLSGQDFSGQDLSGRNFSEAILEGARFRQAVLKGARFSGAVLLGADFTGADLQGAALDRVGAGRALFSSASLNGARLSGGDFTGARLDGADLGHAVLDAASFNQASLEGARLAGATGTGAEFQQANLTRACFEDAWLPDADCSGAVLDQARMARLQAPGLRLAGARGRGASFQGARIPGVRAEAETCLDQADFRQADLTGASLEGAGFPGGLFTEAILERAEFSRTRLADADLRCCRAREACFAKADLTGADLRGIDLLRGSLRQARLVRTDLRKSNLYGVDLARAVLGETRFEEANLHRTLLELQP